MQPSDFPLAWPEGRERSRVKVAGRFKIGFDRAYDQLLDEAERLHDEVEKGGREVVVSTNVPLGKDGLPILGVGRKYLCDPGVAVYVWRGGRPYAIACDTYFEVRHNLRAIWATIRALRTIDRHGTAALLEQSMIGFCREIEVPPRPRLLVASGGGS